MDRSTYPGALLPTELQALTLNYKASAEEFDRNINFLREIYEIFFGDNPTSQQSVEELIETINELFYVHRSETYINIEKYRNQYDEPSYEFHLILKSEFYSDDFLKELLSLLLSHPEVPIQSDQDGLRLKTRRKIAITAINEFARNSSSLIRVIFDSHSELSEVVSICSPNKPLKS